MQLHGIHKTKPTKKFVDRKRETAKEERKARNITRNPGGGVGMTSVLGKMTSVHSSRTLPSSLFLDLLP
jgi:hypothetical protein